MASDDIKPIVRTTVTDTIIKQLKELILRGRFQPGDRLPNERDLSVRFSVGRTSVREALKALEMLGLIYRTQEGTFVAEPQAQPMLSLALLARDLPVEGVFETRKLFEFGIVELAAQRAEADDLAGMRDAMELYRGDPESFTIADTAFHTALAAAARNRVLHQVYTSVTDLLFQSHEMYRVGGGARRPDVLRRLSETAMEEHKRIYAAVADHDPELARDRMREHLNRAERELLAFREEEARQEPMVGVSERSAPR